MGASDQMLARYVAEIEERQQFIDGIIEANDGKDLSDEQAELVRETRNRIEKVNEMMKPLEEARRISGESSERIAALAKFMSGDKKKPTEVEYRSAGEYVIDLWQRGMGSREATERLEIYTRAASHQTTADNPGLIPTPIVEPVVNFIDSSRPLVTNLGPRQMPSQTWSRPKVTQHSSVAVQSAEKAELASQKLTISRLSGTAATYGGYVNVSRQDIQFSQPAIMDLVISDLAAEYAIQTEAAAFTAFDAVATAGITIPTGTATVGAVQTSLWDAASKIYTTTKGQGRVFAITGPDMLPVLGPVFPPINPFNAISAGLSAGDFGTGLVGSITGIPLYVSAGCGASRILVFSSAAAEVYENRIGALQVIEPSVLGVQVAYAGLFSPMVIDGGAIVKIVKTP